MDRLEFKEVYTRLYDVQDRWFDLGLFLDRPMKELNDIQYSKGFHVDHLRDMLYKAVQEGDLTWMKICLALENPVIDKRELANSIREEKNLPKLVEDNPGTVPEEAVTSHTTYDKMSHLPNDINKDEMEYETKQVQLKFAKVLSTVTASFVTRNIQPLELISTVRCYDKHYPLDSNIKDISMYLINQSTFLEYDLLKSITESSACLDEDHLALTEYEEILKEYLQNRIHQEGEAQATIMLDDEMDIGPENHKSIQALRDKAKKLLDIEELSVDFSMYTKAEEVATQDKHSEESGILKGVFSIQEVTIDILKGSHKEFNWEGYGLKLTVPDNALPKGISICRITIKASLSGQYDFPENTELVSPIFWIRCIPSCKFQKPLILEIQHCAPPDNSFRLFMARPLCTQKDLPYPFKVIHGGSFSKHTSYGVIALDQFSANTVIQERSDERRYWSGVFYMGPPTNREIHFTITWHDDAHVTTVKKQYSAKKAIPGPEQSLYFKGDEICLDIQNGHTDEWKIYPAIQPKVSKKEVDDHKPDNETVPHCVLMAKWMKKKQEIKPLVCKVNIQGTIKDDAFFTIDIDPDFVKDEELPNPSIHKLEMKHLQDVSQCLKNLDRDKTIEAGLALGLLYPNLIKMSKLPEDMVSAWFQGMDNVDKGQPTVEKLIQALETSNLKGTADTVRSKFNIS